MTEQTQDPAATAATESTPLEALAPAAPAANEPDQDEAPKADELSVLKSRAKMMGITFSNNISVEKLREKIQAKIDGEAEKPDEDADQVVEAPALKGEGPKKFDPSELTNEAMKLIRCRITNMNPQKKDLHGEIITVANRFIGTVRRFVPFGEATDDGWHIPFCIFQELESKRFLNIRTIRNRQTGAIRVEQSWQREFALDVLTPLTEEELKQLATAQMAAGTATTAPADNYLS